jgi:hypothetical protein
VPNPFLNALLTNSKTSANEPSGPSRRRWWFEYVPSVPFAIKRVETGDDSLEWATENFSTLLSVYPGRWILVRGHRVLASAVEPTDLLQQAIALGIKKPLMLKVEPSTATPRSAFISW